jgi:HTH-type transcriptional regulator/antitoxin HigA
MVIQLIETPADYAAAIKEIDALMSAQAGSAEGQRLVWLAKLVQKYETKHFSFDGPTNPSEKK